MVATRNFSKGDILCDYHGNILTSVQGKKKLQVHQDGDPGYLFFFGDKCIDAQEDQCECHPDTHTLGRLINHSKKKYNLKPIHCVLNIDGQDRDTILFKATKDIKVDEEVKFHYGVERKSFRGEGLDLTWLDD